MTFGDGAEDRETMASPEVDERAQPAIEGSSKLWRIPALYCALLFSGYLLVIAFVLFSPILFGLELSLFDPD